MGSVVMVIAAYLAGSIPFGIIVGKLRGFDPRAVGSGNIGMTNVARVGGSSAALATFIGDVLKGAIPVAIARQIGFPSEVVALSGLAAFVGSICSVFLGFKGGKGVSASLGIWVAVSPLVLLFAMASFAIVFAVSRIMSLASIVAAIVLPPAAAALSLPRPYLLLAIVMTALVLVRHAENIRRLMAGTEPRFQPRSKPG